MRLAEVTDFDAATLEIILNGSADLDRIDGRCRSVSIGLVFAGTTWLEFGPRGFAGVNLVLIATWLVLARWLLKSYRTESAAAVQAEAAA